MGISQFMSTGLEDGRFLGQCVGCLLFLLFAIAFHCHITSSVEESHASILLSRGAKPASPLSGQCFVHDLVMWSTVCSG